MESCCRDEEHVQIQTDQPWEPPRTLGCRCFHRKRARRAWAWLWRVSHCAPTRRLPPSQLQSQSHSWNRWKSCWRTLAEPEISRPETSSVRRLFSRNPACLSPALSSPCRVVVAGEAAIVDGGNLKPSKFWQGSNAITARRRD